jgi:hypothetical protein
MATSSVTAEPDIAEFFASTCTGLVTTGRGMTAMMVFYSQLEAVEERHHGNGWEEGRFCR